MPARHCLPVLLGAGIVAGCGSAPPTGTATSGPPARSVHLSWPMVRAPGSITRYCSLARRRTASSVPAPCPARVPRGVTTLADAKGVLLFDGIWEIGVNNGFDGTTDPRSGRPLIHWMVGAGTAPAFRRLLLDAKQFEVPVAPRVIRRGHIAGAPVETLRYVPGAGPWGGHDVLVATLHGIRIWASVHSHRHDDVATRMLEDLLRQSLPSSGR